MIVFDLHCEQGHRFEGWFGSSSDFEEQISRGLLVCPECGSAKIGKAPMAPAVPAKSNAQTQLANPAQDQQLANAPMPEEVHNALKALAKAQERALKNSTYVGKDFVEQSRAMHYGERDEAPIHGQASLEEAKSLVDEGVEVAPLPFPISPPEDLN